MVKLVFLAMFIFVTLLASMSWTAGTQKSLSALAGTWRWLLLGAIWSQAALLPVMIDMTPEPWRVLAFLSVGCLMFTGATNVLDKNDRPLMIADPTAGGVQRIFGIPVKQEDALADGEILLSAPGVGYIANVNKDMSLSTEEHVKARTADYCAYAIVDGNVITTKAHALLVLGE